MSYSQRITTTKTRAGRVTGKKRAELLGAWPDNDEPAAAPAEEETPRGVAADLAEKLREVARQAMALRKVGVIRIHVGDVAVELLPYVGDPAARGQTAEPEVDPADIHSPHLYPGGRVPTLPRPPRSMREEFDATDEDA